MENKENILTTEEKKTLQAYYNFMINFSDVKRVAFYKIASEVFTGMETLFFRRTQDLCGEPIQLEDCTSYFKNGTHFNGMKIDKLYTPKELGLVTHRKKKDGNSTTIKM